MTSTTEPGRRAAALRYRPARLDEIEDCAGIWRTSINEYILPLGQPEIPPELNQVIRLFRHLQATDPDRFVVAIVDRAANQAAALDGSPMDPDRDHVVGFAAAVVRDRLWFLNMLFVQPGLQGAGVGRRLLAEVMPVLELPGGDHSTPSVYRATATDSAQPISNALYATYGMAPRMPLFNLVGHPIRPEALGELPSGIHPVEVDPSDASRNAAIDALDRDLLGVTHPVDHGFYRREGRRSWLYHGPDGSAAGFGYAGEAGRLGPVAARDPALLAPILGHLTSTVVARGAYALWVGGAADRALVPMLQAGFRMESFPILMCWDRPFADFSRYLPSSPGLL